MPPDLQQIETGQNQGPLQTPDPQDPIQPEPGRLSPEEAGRSLAERTSAVTTAAKRPAFEIPAARYRELFTRIVLQFRNTGEDDLSSSYSAEWMLDNDYLIFQNLRQVEENLPLRFRRQLPWLDPERSKDTAGVALVNSWRESPRIYILAHEIIRLEGAQIDLEWLRRFIAAYQEVAPLTIGELWALPAMLRLGILQALAQAAANLTGLNKELNSIWLPAYQWRLKVTDDEVVASSFISMRTLAAQDWKDLFEELSLVERILGEDPSGDYTRMDFETRDRYRKVVEEIAWFAAGSEIRVARTAVELAQGKAERRGHVGYYLLDRGRRELEARFGYRPPGGKRLKRWLLAHPTLAYLRSIGLLALLLLVSMVSHALNSGGNPWQAALAVLLGVIPASTIAIGMINWVVSHLISPQVLPKLDFSAGIPESSASLVVVPVLLTNEKDIHSLISQLELHYLRNPDPQLSFALLSDFSDSPQPHLPEDAPLLEAAQAGIRLLNSKYAQRNGSMSARDESQTAGGPFLLIHRERRNNPREGYWMGWERKRGKLHELNRLILAAKGKTPAQQKPEDIQGDRQPSAEGAAILAGDPARLREICYVITLDADTILPPEGARRLAGTLAHPLNQAEFNDQGRVAAGYTVLQPRAEINPTSAVQSLFTRIFSGDTGLDLYTLAVSDIYQDLFGEGIYVGKGIYDVAAFEASLAGSVPENALLSHDLFEGVHGRAALATDIVLIEDYPTSYLAHIRRLHRWIRGDWQLLPWLFPSVPAEGGRKLRNTLSLINRWKIFDNLRRSLVAPGLLALFIAAWTGLLPGSQFFWLLAGLLTLAAPLLTGLFSDLVSAARSAFTRGSLRSTVQSLRLSLLRWLLAITFLPFEGLVALNAIQTTLVRLYITRRGLLQWTTAAETERRLSQQSRAAAWQDMAGAVMLAIALAAAVAVLNPAALPFAAPLIAAWLLGAEIAQTISRPIQKEPERLEQHEQERLRRLARQTWLFFEQFISPEDHWLPPDHYQEHPLGVVAHRTSPTNIGLNLLVTLGAYDLGYTGLLGLAARLRSAFDKLRELERYRGHFLNWYDTRTLGYLPPRYVSTVDSGNLAACLIALRQGLLHLEEYPVLRWETFEGLQDSLALLQAAVENLEIEASASEVVGSLLDTIDNLRREIAEVKDYPGEWIGLLFHLANDPLVSASELPDEMETGQPAAHFPTPPAVRREATWGDLNRKLIEALGAGLSQQGADNLRRLRLAAAQTRQRFENAIRELNVLHPWLRLLAAPPVQLQGDGVQPELALAWEMLLAALFSGPKLNELDGVIREARRQLGQLIQALAPEDETEAQEIKDWCDELDGALEAGNLAVKALLLGFNEIAAEAETYFQEMEFRFLFDEDRQIFHIGYNLEVGRLDNNYYDLLASEARIASLLAIAKGDVPPSHWLHLARPIAQLYGRRVLLSWSATMFEYLMPSLLVRGYLGSLLHHSAEAAVDIQINYGQEKGVPWGISESGYFRFDQNQSYQYRAFGVPGLGYKRGLGEDLVIAPYASLLALPYRPRAVVQNLARMEELEGMGTFGLYEALDFTPARLSIGKRYEIVREYMAHHHGMIFLSLGNYFKEDRMVTRFHSDPRIQSVELLLQEQVPERAPIEQPHTEEGRSTRPQQPQVLMTPWRAEVTAPQPVVHILSNGRYGLLITASGGGYSTWGDTDLTRWRSDTSLGDWGAWIYIQDMESHKLWSAGLQPTGAPADSLDVYFSPHMAAFLRRDGEITTEMDITVANDADVEIRRVSLTNHTSHTQKLRLTSYAEVILAPQPTDRRHPAFNKLFLESEWVSEHSVLLFRRRPRSEKEESIFLGHLVAAEPGISLTGAFESDRKRFLGRGGTVRAAQALAGDGWLSGTAGATLDPIISLGQEISLPPHGSVQIAFITLVARSRDEVLEQAARFSTWSPVERAFEGARAAAEVELQQLGLNSVQLPRLQRLLSACLFPHSSLRASPETLAANRKGQPALWAYAISGDYPLILARLDDQEAMPLVQDLLQAHLYWRNRNLKIDLVFINEQGSSYGGELTGQVHRLLSRTGSDAWLNRRGGIFILMADLMNPEDRTLLESTARAILDGKKGSLAEQLPVGERLTPPLPAFVPSLPDMEAQEPTPPLRRPTGLRSENGVGGFSSDGREYLLFLEPGCWTPAPWVNVIANPAFGCLVSEAALGFTWALNSGENRLTPWSNDPVSDPPSEALYLRDEETAAVWSPTPLPAGGPAPYLVRHGAGYSVFEHHSYGLKQTLRVFAAADDPVKVIQLRLENLWGRPRRITVTYYAEWVLGVNREDMQAYIIPEFEAETQALLARNPYQVEFGERVAFAAASKNLHGLTADRTEFLGSIGDRKLPAGLTRIGLSGSVRAGLDPCAALQLHIDLQPGDAEEVYFLLGQGEDRQSAVDLLRHYRQAENVAAAWEVMTERWERLLGAVQVRTPEPELDLLLNRWLLYQALGCRIWGRSAFYQSSGAYGFRDQLQDVMSLIFAAPELAREHILRAARHQFEAGDVLHWWHPPSGRGVRTRFSDDLLWLPYVTAFYVFSTGDEAVLDERLPFLQGPPLEPEEDERYGHYLSTREDFTLYEHCLRAIEKGATSGPHGIPLIGGGDWNDGMNRVGIEGRGESIWLGWFLIRTLNDFAEIAARRERLEQAKLFRERAEEIAKALEANGWDGEWYLRAYHDDGSPIGSSKNLECRIDSIAQSWAVLAEAGTAEHIQSAMRSVFERLVRPEERLILLFTPPFDRTPRDPGYIKGYLPGIRENGGQYTHAAIWTVWAFARLGQGDRAGQLFRLLNPILHADQPEKLDRYQVEPYVIAADVYSVPPHTGRGGWTWYTGSAGWMYRLGLEAILGLRREGQALALDPCIPSSWPGFEITVRAERAVYQFQVENPDRVCRGVAEISLDGKLLPDGKIPLLKDQAAHQVRVRLGS
jgi:cyclic beta-1,2-glucan synthetase